MCLYTQIFMHIPNNAACQFLAHKYWKAEDKEFLLIMYIS